ncbi:MAG TPA: YfhO family protein [Oscillatoriaceae cyanobacterium]
MKLPDQMDRSWRAWSWGVLLLLVLLGSVFAEGLVGTKGIGGASMLPYQDAMYGPMPVPGALPGRGGQDSTPELYNQPWDTLAWNEMASGQLPLWQPYNAFGKPLLASAQAAPFNPLKLLFAFGGAKGPAEAWFLVMRLAIAGVGVLLLARKLGLAPLGGVLAAVGFMFNGTFIYHFQYSDTTVFVILPWLMLSAERMLEAPKWRRTAEFGLLIGLTGLLGHPESALFAAASAVVSVALGARLRRRMFALLALACLLGAGVAACTVLPMFELVRAADSYLLHSNTPWQPAWGFSYAQKAGMLFSHLLTGTATDGFRFNPSIGVLGLGLAPLGLGIRRLNRSVLALVAIAGLGFLVGFPGQQLALLPFPIHSVYMPPLLSLALALLGGTGLDRVVRSPKRYAPLAIGSLALLVASRIGLIGGGLLGMRVFLVSSGIALVALALMWIRPRRFWPPVLVASACLQLGWNARLTNPPQPLFEYATTPILRYLQSQHAPTRVAGRLRALMPDTNVMYRLDSLDSYEVFNIERYSRFMGVLDGIPCGNFQETSLTSGFTPALLSLANVKYLLVPDPQPKTGPLASYPIRMRQGHLALRENPGALPRAWVSYEADFVPDEATAAKILGATPSRWLTQVLLETPGGKAPAGWQDAASGITSVQLLWRNSQDVTLEATLTHPGWLVLSDIYYPGWKAEVDGKPAQILPADVAFRAVYLTPGTHRVVFTYASRIVALGFGVTLLALLVSLGLLFVKPGRSLKRQEPFADAA